MLSSMWAKLAHAMALLDPPRGSDPLTLCSRAVVACSDAWRHTTIASKGMVGCAWRFLQRRGFPRWAELLTQQQLADIGAVLQADHERASREPHYCQDRMVELLHNLPAGTFKEALKREQPTRSGGTSMDCWTLSHSGMEAAWHLEGPGHDMLWVEVHPGMPPGMAMVNRQPNGSTQ